MTRPRAPGPRWSKKTDELVRYVAANCRPGLQSELGRWLEDGSRFRAFVAADQDKIRKKLVTTDEETRQDVRAELLVAQLLLRDRRFAVAFETYGAQRLGPDYTVSYRTNLRFNLEVTRLRAPEATPDKMANVIAGKLRQLPVDLPNALVIVTRDIALDRDSLASALRLLKVASDRKDDAFFVHDGLKDARDFSKRYVRLGGVFVVNEAGPPPRAIFSANREARRPLPAEAVAGLTACLGLAEGV
jgi:hypothetical protein